MLSAECDCAEYDDLPIDLKAVEARVELYREMRPKLRKLGQKLVGQWSEHYRLYKCDACGQYWQSTLAPRDSDLWYLFKVPKITVKAWKQSVYVPPGEIAKFLEERTAFLAKEFETKDTICNERGCSEHAIVGSTKCMYHQFLQIGFGETLSSLLSMRWFPPYSPELLQLNHTMESDA